MCLGLDVHDIYIKFHIVSSYSFVFVSKYFECAVSLFKIKSYSVSCEYMYTSSGFYREMPPEILPVRAGLRANYTMLTQSQCNIS